jgi:5-methylcytosine-specific restriction endonuclease McrA
MVSVAESIASIEAERAARAQPVETHRERAQKFYASSEWRRLRYKILRRDGGKCVLCGRGAADGVTLHVDHIVPLSKDWSRRLDPDNLQALCGGSGAEGAESCNLGKSNTDSIDWRPQQVTDG